MQRDREPVCAREGGPQAGAHERSVSHDGETPRPRPFQELERKREWSLAEHPRDKKPSYLLFGSSGIRARQLNGAPSSKRSAFSHATALLSVVPVGWPCAAQEVRLHENVHSHSVVLAACAWLESRSGFAEHFGWLGRNSVWGAEGGCAASPSGRTNSVPPSCCQLPPPNLLALPDERNPP